MTSTRGRRRGSGGVWAWTTDPLMLLVTVVGVIVAVIGVYLAYLTYRQGDEPDGAVTGARGTAASTGSAGATTAVTNGATTGVRATPSTSATSVPACGVPATGSAVDCDAGEAALRVWSACEKNSILTVWGLDPALDALDLVVLSTATGCWVSPGPTARQAGARAADLLQAAGGAVSGSLRLCARGQALMDTACSRPHEVEWIGDWAPKADRTATAEFCRAQAVSYTRMTVSGMENRLIAQAAERTAGSVRQLRCLVRAEGVTLDGSLRNLRNAELPVAMS